MNKVYIFDLDGTLADGHHRLHHILGKEKRWGPFFEACHLDAPIHPTIEIFKALQAAGHSVWIWSARNAMVAQKTVDWLVAHGLHPTQLRLRDEDDHTNDDVLKKQWLDALSPEDRGRIAGVFEDRNRVVSMWREAGLTCYHVAEGDF